ncbi:ATP-dependent DNA helicase DinG [Azospirillum fermentarium]|uniref:ATP-dependent DNA helicase n=1 Tax=Azospirillum fermentarium TaxID=1233114 RepID=UPI0022261E2F|nr:ATP-dependent DNA helicase [Azospirillum fermentarium]MCW2247234.1 ATP-dependent DNA helicase DinG [Azospirillum fermentarium]
MPGPAVQSPYLPLDEAPAVVVRARHGVILSPDGEVETLPLDRLAGRLRGTMPVVCHGRALARRLGMDPFPAYDVLELYAFVKPATFCLPTPRGLADALGLPLPEGAEADAVALLRAVPRLLRTLAAPGRAESSDPVAIAWEMGKAGWPWAGPVLHALNMPQGPERARALAGLKVWAGLKEWEEGAPVPPPTHTAVDPEDARRRLAQMLTAEVAGKMAEPRPQQADYASAVAAAFAPRPAPETPNVVLAEAGTGVGKTLGYLAPATVWAEKNGGAVWVSTYTRNLQHQIDAELDRLFPDPAEKARRVVLRKGRENYLCLLNLEDAVRAAPAQYGMGAMVAAGLMARWAAATRDGDLSGGDFPGWLVDLLGRPRTLGLADRRGECVYSACDHYSKCFIEKSVRRARRAEVVIANHALVMIQAALGGGDDMNQPTRFIFDEGHHVFDAADSAFAGHLTGRETHELRRWFLGVEEGGRGRARGLKRRMEDVVAGDDEASALLDAVLEAARVLPSEGWGARLSADNPTGPTERFLLLARAQVYARTAGDAGPYSLEADTAYPVDGLLEAAANLDAALARLAEPVTNLARRLAQRLDDEAAELDSDQRRRLDALSRSLTRRGTMTLAAWRDMLKSLSDATPVAYVDWFAVERAEGRDVDVGLYRHWIDPTVPFAEALAGQAHGMVVTSATLTDGTGDLQADWGAAEARSGASHLPRPAVRAQVPSPFDYRNQTRVLVVTDVRKDDLAQVSAAYRELFLAAGGGGLGLFTAISRLRSVYDRIVEPLDTAGLPLYAQHVDPLDVSTLIDIFRGEEHACLLGTDAVRDGVDVPGRSLRLIVFDRVPWPRPDILHRARRNSFGRRRYEDMIARLRLKQAFGRLVRRADDVGVFVLLDPMMPSRLFGAFPEGVEVRRVGLREAVAETRGFLLGPGRDNTGFS